MKVKSVKRVVIFCSLGIVLSLLSCEAEEVEKASSVSDSSTFILYVSNQSFALDTVDIKISIDTDVYVDQWFATKDQHNWQQYTFTISKGVHTLRAVTEMGEAAIEKTIPFTQDKHWGQVDYFFNTDSYSDSVKYFNVKFSDTAITVD